MPPRPSLDRAQPRSGRAGSHRPTRRRFLQSLGAGAVALGGASAGVGSAAAQDEQSIEGVEEWSLETERVDHDDVADGPSVTYEDDAVVVTGTHVFPRTGCDTFQPRRIYCEDPEAGIARLGVVIETVATAEPDEPCATAEMPLQYELRVVPEANVRETVVEEAFSDDGPSYHPSEFVASPEPLPPEVTDYEFETFELETGLTPEDAAAMEPTVTVEDGDVTIEGAMAFGSSSCDEIRLEAVRREHDVEGHVGVRVRDRRQETHLPGDGCDLVLEAARYRVELTGSGDPPITRCSVAEDGELSSHRLTVETDDPGVELPQHVQDYRLEIEPGGDSDLVDEPPRVSVSGERDGRTVVVEGTTTTGSSSCGTLELGELYWSIPPAADAPSELLARLDRTSRRADLGDCTDDVVTADYRLEIVVEELPQLLTVQEGVDGEEEPRTEVRTRLGGQVDADLPDGVASVELLVGDDVLDNTVEPPSPTAYIADGAFVAYGDQFDLADHLCETVAVAELEFHSEERDHFHVVLGNEHRQGVEDPEVSCVGDPERVAWRLRVEFEGTPPRSVALETREADLESSFTVVDSGHEPAHLADVVQDVAIETGSDVAAPDEPDLTVTDDRVTFRHVVETDPCRRPAVERATYDAEERQLEVHLDMAFTEGSSPFGTCGGALGPVPYEVELDLDEQPDDATVTTSDSLGGLEVGADTPPCERSATVDGWTVCDVNGDGLYRDVDGDGDVAQSDVVTFFENQHREAWKRPDLFDFSDTDSVGHSDVVALFEDVVTP